MDESDKVQLNTNKVPTQHLSEHDEKVQVSDLSVNEFPERKKRTYCKSAFVKKVKHTPSGYRIAQPQHAASFMKIFSGSAACRESYRSVYLKRTSRKGCGLQEIRGSPPPDILDEWSRIVRRKGIISCPFGCGRKFVTRQGARYHYIRCEGADPVIDKRQCLYCPETFEHRLSHYQHHKSAHPTFPFPRRDSDHPKDNENLNNIYKSESDEITDSDAERFLDTSSVGVSDDQFIDLSDVNEDQSENVALMSQDSSIVDETSLISLDESFNVTESQGDISTASSLDSSLNLSNVSIIGRDLEPSKKRSGKVSSTPKFTFKNKLPICVQSLIKSRFHKKRNESSPESESKSLKTGNIHESFDSSNVSHTELDFVVKETVTTNHNVPTSESLNQNNPEEPENVTTHRTRTKSGRIRKPTQRLIETTVLKCSPTKCQSTKTEQITATSDCGVKSAEQTIVGSLNKTDGNSKHIKHNADDKNDQQNNIQAAFFFESLNLSPKTGCIEGKSKIENLVRNRKPVTRRSIKLGNSSLKDISSEKKCLDKSESSNSLVSESITVQTSSNNQAKSSALSSCEGKHLDLSPKHNISKLTKGKVDPSVDSQCTSPEPVVTAVPSDSVSDGKQNASPKCEFSSQKEHCRRSSRNKSALSSIRRSNCPFNPETVKIISSKSSPDSPEVSTTNKVCSTQDGQHTEQRDHSLTQTETISSKQMCQRDKHKDQSVKEDTIKENISSQLDSRINSERLCKKSSTPDDPSVSLQDNTYIDVKSQHQQSPQTRGKSVAITLSNKSEESCLNLQKQATEKADGSHQNESLTMLTRRRTTVQTSMTDYLSATSKVAEFWLQKEKNRRRYLSPKGAKQIDDGKDNSNFPNKRRRISHVSSMKSGSNQTTSGVTLDASNLRILSQTPLQNMSTNSNSQQAQSNEKECTNSGNSDFGKSVITEQTPVSQSNESNKGQEDIDKARTCLRCGLVLKDHYQLRYHMMSAHNRVYTTNNPEGRVDLTYILQRIKRLRCEKCQLTFKTKYSHSTHTEWCGNENKTLSCKYCNEDFRVIGYQGHMSRCRRKLLDKERRKEDVNQVHADANTPDVYTQPIVVTEPKHTVHTEPIVLSQPQHGRVVQKSDSESPSKPSTEPQAEGRRRRKAATKARSNMQEYCERMKPSKESRKSFKDEIDGEGDNNSNTNDTQSESQFTGGTFPLTPRRDDSLQYRPCEECLQWTFDFVKVNFQDFLYSNWKSLRTNWATLKESQRECYLPKHTESPYVRIERMYNSTMVKIKRFESSIEGGMTMLHTGGPVWSAEWCPLPVGLVSPQYIAISCVQSVESMNLLDNPVNSPGLIQIWNCGHLQNAGFSGVVAKPYLALAIALDYGPVWAMNWCPSGGYEKHTPNGDKQPFLPRLGLLAVTSNDGIVRIYSTPQPEKLCGAKSVNVFYKTKPVALLHPTAFQSGTKTFACTSIDWSLKKGHKIIAAGYSNGQIALWDLSTQSSLLRKITSDGTTVLYAYHTFLAHTSIVRGLSLQPYTERHLVSVSKDRYIAFWDLENTDCAFNYERKSEFTDVVWPMHWANTYSISDDCYSYQHNSSAFIEAGYFGYQTRPMTAHNACIWGLSHSNWLNTIVTSDSAGEVVGIYLPAMIFLDTYNKHKPKRRFSVLRVNMEALPSKSGDNKTSNINPQPGKQTDDKGIRNDKAQTGRDDEEAMDPGPASYQEFLEKCCLVYNEGEVREKRVFGNDKRLSTTSNMNEFRPDCETLQSMNKVAWNPNASAHTWLLVGGITGLVSLHRVSALYSKHFTPASDKYHKEGPT